MTQELVVGEKAPEFSLPDQDGSTVTLKSLKGKQVVLYFYPKDDTSGCTKEACDFRDSLAPIKKMGAVVLGVSMDGKVSHLLFFFTGLAIHHVPFGASLHDGPGIRGQSCPHLPVHLRLYRQFRRDHPFNLA